MSENKKETENSKEQKTQNNETAQEIKEDSKDIKIRELTEMLQRLQAEFENYRKRVERDVAMIKKFASQDLIIKLLPILDSFELALEHKESDKEKFVKGIEMIYAQLFSALESEGLRPINALGKNLDPNYHEVLLQEQSDKEDETILEELQKGYMINDRVIRFAKVKISAQKIAPAQKQK